MKFNIDWARKTTITAGNGSVSIDTPIGSGTNVSNLVPRCNCCQFCPFTDGAIYTSLPAQIKCTLTDEFHFCDDTHCDVKEKVISIEWLRIWEEKHKNDPCYCNFVTDEILADWEKENEID